jgi:hypothetical protein
MSKCFLNPFAHIFATSFSFLGLLIKSIAFLNPPINLFIYFLLSTIQNAPRGIEPFLLVIAFTLSANR